jgi:hypothetical protein
MPSAKAGSTQDPRTCVRGYYMPPATRAGAKRFLSESGSSLRAPCVLSASVVKDQVRCSLSSSLTRPVRDHHPQGQRERPARHSGQHPGADQGPPGANHGPGAGDSLRAVAQVPGGRAAGRTAGGRRVPDPAACPRAGPHHAVVERQGLNHKVTKDTKGHKESLLCGPLCYVWLCGENSTATAASRGETR